MANGPTAGSIDEYIAGFPPETQKALEEVRALIRAVAPAATEKISYAIPAFDLHGTLIYFAGFKVTSGSTRWRARSRRSRMISSRTGAARARCGFPSASRCRAT